MNAPTITISGKKLTIEVDLSNDEGISRKGNSILVSSTHGFKFLPDREDGLAVALNVIKSLGRYI